MRVHAGVQARGCVHVGVHTRGCVHTRVQAGTKRVMGVLLGGWLCVAP